MLNYKNAFWTLVLVIAVLAGFRFSTVTESPRESSSRKVAFVTGGSNSYWRLTAAGAKKAAREFNLDLVLLMPEKAEDLSEQMQLIAKLEPSEFAGIAFSPLDAESQTLLINRLAEETTIVTFDSDAPLSNRQGYVGTSNYGAGQKCAKLVHEAVPQGGKIAVLMANQTKANLIDRRNGFASDLNRLLPGELEVQPQNYEIVDYLIDRGDSAKSAELIEQTLAEHPDLACFVGLNAKHGPILLEVLEKLDKLGQVQLVTFDEADDTLAGIEAGHIYATVAQDPYMFGYEAVRIISSRKKLGLEAGDRFGRRAAWTVPSEIVKKENLVAFREGIESLKKEAEQLVKTK